MKLRILLINPWIYDFAAYNFWARPLGLLKVAEYLSSFDTDLSLLDCTDSFHAKRYGAGRFTSEPVAKPRLLKEMPRQYKRYGISIDTFIDRLKDAMPFEAVLMTSIMSYWYPGVQTVVELIRETLGSIPVILGGIYPTLYHEHASRNSGADFIYSGSAGDALNFALYTFGFRLSRKKDSLPYYDLGLYESHPFAPLLTTEGCPFTCSYCASRLLRPAYTRRPPAEVLREIRDLYSLGVRDYAFYDDALLFDADHFVKPLLRNLVGEGLDVRFHTPNGLHARFIDEELARLMKTANFTSLRLSLETIDNDRQTATGGKVNSEDMVRAVGNLKARGFTKQELGVYLMYGLPGQDIQEVRDGVRFLKDLGVRINLTEFCPIRGTGSWRDLVERGIITDDLDPLLTNNTVFSYLYSDYDWKALEKLRLHVKEYNASPN